jgi:hypothetical protein
MSLKSVTQIILGALFAEILALLGIDWLVTIQPPQE